MGVAPARRQLADHEIPKTSASMVRVAYEGRAEGMFAMCNRCCNPTPCCNTKTSYKDSNIHPIYSNKHPLFA